MGEELVVLKSELDRLWSQVGQLEEEKKETFDVIEEEKARLTKEFKTKKDTSTDMAMYIIWSMNLDIDASFLVDKEEAFLEKWGCKVYGHTERMCTKKPVEVWREKTRVRKEEDSQIPVNLSKVAETTETVPTATGPAGAGSGNAVSEAPSGSQLEVDKTIDNSKSVPDLPVVNQARTPVEGGSSDWVTPKRIGGNKRAINKTKNTLKNSYSALQDKVVEVANLGLKSTSALLETKLWGDKIKKMMQSFFSGWEFSSGSASEGRLLLIWQPNLVSVDVLKETDQLLHVFVRSLKANKSFCVTFVYGRNSIEERVALWKDLSNLSYPVAAWLIAGDFNAAFESEHRVGGRAISSLELADAQNWRALGLVDELRARGSHFTWTNKQMNEGRIFSRLDRVFKNEDWLDIFPHSEAVFNWELHSDHCYCIIKPDIAVNYGVKLFRFFNIWAKHDQFKSTVMQSWCRPMRGTGLVRLCNKLRRLQLVLQRFNRHIMGDVAHNFFEAKEKYQVAQVSLQGDPHSLRLQKIEADAVNESGQSIENFDAVFDHFVNHFTKIMGSKSMASSTIQKSCFELGHQLTLDQQVSLVKPFSTKEVKEAFFGINSIKSPGPDGFGSGFFKALWSELETEISAAVLDFFEYGVLSEEINKATISLVPKIETPSRAADYRPIACCTSIYKCISKMLCSRLALVLPSLVNQNQGAFVKNRLLAHNILILQDIIKGYKRKNISPRCVFKIDLSKAYDMLDWNFLEDILIEFRFPAKFIKWVMDCLKDPTYLLLMNGKVQGEFRGRKGLRQGDPISPLLFVLAMEYCTRLFQQASMNKGYRFHPKCKHLKIVNLCFADDLVIFCKGVHNSVQIIKESFSDFCCASGLTANKDKSQVYFGGVAEDEAQNLLEGLHFTEGHFPLKYLGVPLRTTRWKAGDCSRIIKKIQSKLHTWASRHLSLVGRVQLINSVLLSIRTFWMSIFILPKSVTKEVDRLCRNFLWGVKDGNFQRSKLHFTAWDQVCLPKCMGGLGFKDSNTWNLVLLAKYVWEVSSKHDILWVKWVDSIYLKGHNFWHYRVPQDVSWYWKRLLKLIDIFPGCRLDEAVHLGKLSLKLLYHRLINKDRVVYANVVWNSLTVPKHRFILW
ncbi:uncharacterized protein LOC133791852 [Humulus lupulus]|uniref:uncharacterized protein LOC133791852 n=1 Tax=Humulus lupulus TaxID=3486 RepID=UPI002B408B76|nr:uncharacterized protein LOC133791852 [Humulus lupulus]